MARPSPRRIDPIFAECDHILFLALFWGGNPLCALKDLIALYDWVNHDIPTAVELDGALNRLMAAGLVVQRRGGFCLAAKAVRAFETFRRRHRRYRFTMARAFVDSAGPLKSVARRLTIRDADQSRAYAEYRRMFQAHSH